MMKVTKKHPVPARRTCAGVLGVLAVLVGAPGIAGDWPLSDPVILEGFGQLGAAGINQGITITSDSTEVAAIDDGEVIYYADAEDPFMTGMGTMAVVKHERGLLSIYSHLESVHLGDGRLEAGEVLGTMGDSGYAFGPQLHLELMDTELEQSVNPLLVLPRIPEDVKPVIEALRIEGDAGLVFDFQGDGDAEPGSYRVLVKVWDPAHGVDFVKPLPPFQVQLFANGEQVADITFEALRYSEDGFMLSRVGQGFGPYPYSRDMWCDLGTMRINPGRTRFEAVVRDFAGNERSKVFEVTAR